MTSKLGERLRAAAALPDRSERTLRLAAVIHDALSEAGDRPVLVGGAAVEIYTRAMYMTADLDFVATGGRKTAAAMRRLGFERRGRVWAHAGLAIVVEFPSSALAPARSTTMEVGETTIEVICVEDLIVDRLAAWKHWGWQPDGVAAGLLLDIHGPGLDEDRLRKRAEDEDVVDALAALRVLLHEQRQLSEERLAAIHRTLSKP